MIYHITILFTSFVIVVYACIPTQNVDPVTTTTVATTTTTVTEPPFPCSACPKIYDPACQGLGIPNLLTGCPTAAEAGITYALNAVIALFPFVPANSCSTVIVCPPTTTLEYVVLGTKLLGGSPAIAWCEETGPNAGKWYTGVSFIARIEMYSLSCVPIISG
ncbi:hypothetical protein CRE_00659 [Caenorhabditis remanei]|uniref:DUF281 domain-containing protein n=1 Tax=Caenorhabditis remanei TaxID=31234 RepID=E3LDP0_CAERE|nr:hypothetical protein CRE_00659 [Caenorhabditis remanei]